MEILFSLQTPLLQELFPAAVLSLDSSYRQQGGGHKKEIFFQVTRIET